MNIEYYAVLIEHTLGYVFTDNGKKMLGILHESILKGATFRVPASVEPVYIQDTDTVRKATKEDFDSYRVSLPSDFEQIQKMNGYKCFYKGKTLEVYANTSYEAQKKAAELFKAKKSYDVTVVLCEKNGEQITHIPDF